MVLEDVDNPPPDSFTPDASSHSTPNPYSTTSTTFPGLPATSPSSRAFDSTTFPRPRFIPSPSEELTRHKAEAAITFAERKINRPFTPAEAHALAYHMYALESTKQYYTAAGLAAGLWRWYATMKTNQYPFYRPDPAKVDPKRFLMVKGPWAGVARQSWRAMLYVVVASQMGSLVGQIVAQPVAAAAMAGDPELQGFAEEIKRVEERQRVQGGRGRGVAGQGGLFGGQDGMGSGRAAAEGARAPERKWMRGEEKENDDDMSPTAGSEPWDASVGSESSWDRFSHEAEQSSSSAQTPPSQRSSQSSLWQRKPSQPHRQDHSSAPFADDDNDASATGGFFADEHSSPTTQQQQQQQQQPQPAPLRPGESSWDRLRRGGAPLPPTIPNPSSRRARRELEEERDISSSSMGVGAVAGAGEEAVWGAGDEERKRERELAQREFDERVERERRMGDEEEGRGASAGAGRRRW